MKKISIVTLAVLIAVFVIGLFLFGPQSANEAEAQGLVEYAFFSAPTHLEFTIITFHTWLNEDAPHEELWKTPNVDVCTEHETEYYEMEQGGDAPFVVLGLKDDAAATLGAAPGSIMYIGVYPESTVTVCGTNVYLPDDNIGYLVQPGGTPPF